MSADLPDWNDLRDVLTIHEAGSLSAAARVGRVSQSTMSRRLAAIEAGGRKLFVRASDGKLALTPRGRVMVDAARAMRAAYDAELATADPVEPPLRIAACEVTAKLFLADALPDWARRSAVPAGLSVYDDLFSLPPVDYDLLVSPMDAPPPGAEAVEIGRIRWGLFAAPDYLAGHPVPPDTARLHGHDVIRACGTLERFAAFGWLVSLGGRAALLSSSPMAQRDACARGVGIALLPVDLVDEDVGLRPIAVAPPPDSPVWLVADQRQASHPRIADFLRWARRRFARDRAGVEQRTLIPAVSG